MKKRFLTVLAVFAMLGALLLTVCSCGGGETPDDPDKGDEGDVQPVTYQVSFNTMGGSAIDPQTVKEGECPTLPTPPTRLGYDFVGWNIDFTKPVTKDVVARATWKAKPELEKLEFSSIGSSLTITKAKDLYATEYILPDYVTAIGNEAFKDCNKLVTVDIPESVISIGDGAFDGCGSLSRVTIPGNTVYVGQGAFRNCTSLVSVTLSAGAEGIEDGAFEGCIRLAEVVNNSSVDIVEGASDNGGIAKYAFSVHAGESNIAAEGNFIYLSAEDTSYLLTYKGAESEVALPATLGGKSYTVCSYAFYELGRVNSVVLSDGVTSVLKDAFYNCTKLYSVTLGAGLATVADGAFNNCYRLVEVINRSSLTLQAGTENNGNVALYAKAIHNGESIIDTVGDFLFITAADQNYLFAYCGNAADVVLPEDYKGENYGICEYAFKDNTALKTVVIPLKVKSIGKRAFEGCSAFYAAEFMQPNGWWVAPTANAGSGTSIPGSNLGTGGGAAKFLKDNYVNHYWGSSK